MAKVDILVLTYNQEKFIGKTLQSLIDQQCPSGFKIIINDDGSTDGTQKILKEFAAAYPKIIDLQLNEKNLGIPGNFYNAALRSNSDYICLCGGDDYWDDVHKLSNQVEILDNNINIGMVYTDYSICDEDGNILRKVKVPQVTLESLLSKNLIAAVTVCFKRTGFIKYLNEIKPEDKGWRMEDYPMWLWFAKNKLVFHLPHNTSVYRVGHESITHNKDVNKRITFVKSVASIKKFYCDFYNVNKFIYIYEYERYELLHLFLSVGDFISYKKECNSLTLKNLKYFYFKLISLNQLIFNCTYRFLK